MILTHDSILEYIHRGFVKIQPFDKSNIGPASIDLTLDNHIRIFRNIHAPVDIHHTTHFKKLTKRLSLKKGYVLEPGELVLGITKEKITLPDNICGWINSRSRFARLGFMSHIAAPFIAPGVSNKQVLEIYNAAHYPIKIFAGVKVCQLILQECKGHAQYRGLFNWQKL